MVETRKPPQAGQPKRGRSGAVEAPATESGSPPTPGSYFVRPTRNEAENSKEAFYDLFNSVRTSKDLPLSTIAEILQDDTKNFESNLSHRITDRRLSEDDRRLVLDYIFDDKNVISGKARAQVSHIPDALYFAFLVYFDAKETSQDNARAKVVGTYKLWRFSVEHEGEFVLGRLRFEEDEETRALRVEMLQRRKAEPGYRALTERFTGYLFRISHMYLMLLRDELANDCRITIFPRAKLDHVGTDINPRSMFKGSRLHIVHMDGFGLGIDGSSGFFSPTHLSLVDDVDEIAALDDVLDVVGADDEKVPERVAAKLRRNGPLRRL